MEKFKKLQFYMSVFLMSSVGWAMNVLWMFTAISIEGNRGVGKILMLMAFTGLMVLIIAKSQLSRMNFYGKYILGITANFVIIIIATKFTESINYIVMILLSQTYILFRILGNNEGLHDLENDSKRSILITDILSVIGFVTGATIFSIYKSFDLLSNIYATLGILSGIATILIYTAFSHEYSKRSKDKSIDHDDSRFVPVELIKSCSLFWGFGRGVVLMAFYVATLLSTINVSIVAIAVTVPLVLLTIARSIVEKDRQSYFEYRSILAEIILMLILGIVLFVV